MSNSAKFYLLLYLKVLIFKIPVMTKIPYNEQKSFRK
jgi:hypothetical protein